MASHCKSFSSSSIAFFAEHESGDCIRCLKFGQSNRHCRIKNSGVESSLRLHWIFNKVIRKIKKVSTSNFLPFAGVFIVWSLGFKASKPEHFRFLIEPLAFTDRTARFANCVHRTGERTAGKESFCGNSTVECFEFGIVVNRILETEQSKSELFDSEI